jgi:hypothetical protein
MEWGFLRLILNNGQKNDEAVRALEDERRNFLDEP